MKGRLRVVAKRRRLRVVVSGRHFCSTCANRVFPYDGMEKQTEAPITMGGRGRVLLFSSNAYRAAHDEAKIAYCWVCERFVETERVTQGDLIQRYLTRRGVTVRFKKGGGAVLRLPKRRSA